MFLWLLNILKEINLDVHSRFVDLYSISSADLHVSPLSFSHFRFTILTLNQQDAPSVRGDRLAYEKALARLRQRLTHRHPVLPSNNQLTLIDGFPISASSIPLTQDHIPLTRGQKQTTRHRSFIHTQGQQNEIEEICLYLLYVVF